MSSGLIVCDVCKATFSELSKLRLHNYRLHSTEVNVFVNGVSTRVLRNDDGVFLCPCCSRQKYTSPDSLKRHLKKHFQDQEAKATTQTDNESEGNQSCTDSDTEVDNDDTVAVILDTEITTPLSTAQEVVKEIHSTQDYKTAVLSAFDALSQPSEDQEKKLLIAELGDLKPVAYIDHQGKEHSLLAASKVIDSLTSSQKKEKQSLFLAITPKKRNHSGVETETNPSPSIRSVVLDSPYKNLLSKAKYIELDHQSSLFLNNSWSINPIATHIATKILEEMILVEGHKALLVLCGEIYGRLPSLDAHYEKTSTTKGNFPQCSLPHIDTRYPNLELCLLNVDRSQKLVLGTKTMNVLITSSIRIDCNEKPTIGPSSSNGFLPSRQTRIFIEKTKIEEVQRMIEKKSTFNEIGSRQVLLYPFDEFAQLRQLRSKFDKISTYLCYRFSSKYTNDCRTRPFTIWTLADRSTNRDEDSTNKSASKLFRYIATSVWKKGEEALLEQEFVVTLRDQYKPKHKIQRIYEEIDKLYDKDTPAISIIANKDLNRQLKKLASLLSSEISEGNERIASNIYHYFNETSC